MFKAIKRWWKYLGAALSGKLEEAADPKIQLEQAIREAQEQHRRLTEQAANVIAQQKQTQMRLDRATADLEKINGSARQALLLSDEAAKANDSAKMQQFNQAAEGFANRLVALENEVAGLRSMLLEQARNADNAKAAVQQNSLALQQKLSERQKLLSQLDQAKMQEQMNKAMSQLSASVGDDVPTFAEVGISGIDVSLWFGISGPAGMPAAVVQRLNAEIGKVLQLPDIKDALARQGAVPMGGPPERYDAFVRAEQARWGDVVRKNNIKVD